jgi:molybdopterin/thiamine biosynthesis adenylyltransferase
VCKEVILIDGDAYDESNSDRQRTDERYLGLNKADVQAEQLKYVAGEIGVHAIGEFLGPDNIQSVVREKDLILICVDNHATRKLINDTAKKMKDVVLISSGNDLHDGNVQVFIRVGGRAKTAPLDKYHDEIKYPTDSNPAELSCEELAQIPGGGQIIFTNLTAASLSLNAFYAVIKGDLEYGEVYFDCLQNQSKSLVRN